jgi:hypothetical protein
LAGKISVDKLRQKPDAINNGGTSSKRSYYSFMLKLAMCLTKVDAATAQKYAEKAAAGGTLASVADDAYLLTDGAHGIKTQLAGMQTAIPGVQGSGGTNSAYFLDKKTGLLP